MHWAILLVVLKVSKLQIKVLIISVMSDLIFFRTISELTLCPIITNYAIEEWRGLWFLRPHPILTVMMDSLIRQSRQGNSNISKVETIPTYPLWFWQKGKPQALVLPVWDVPRQQWLTIRRPPIRTSSSSWWDEMTISGKGFSTVATMMTPLLQVGETAGVQMMQVAVVRHTDFQGTSSLWCNKIIGQDELFYDLWFVARRLSYCDWFFF